MEYGVKMNNIISIDRVLFKVIYQRVKMKSRAEEGRRGQDGTMTRFILIHRNTDKLSNKRINTSIDLYLIYCNSLKSMVEDGEYKVRSVINDSIKSINYWTSIE